MNHRERQLAAIRHQLPDRIPVDAQAVENTNEIAALLGIAPENVAGHLGLDGAVVGLDYLRRDRDEWGTPSHHDWGTSHPYPLADAEDIRALERHAWPNPDDYDYQASRRRAQECAGEYAVRGPRCALFFHQLCNLMGLENALIKLMLNPVFFEGAVERISQISLECCRRYVQACGENLDCLCIWEDFATQRGMLLSPELWRRYFRPQYAALFEIGKKAGKYIWFHSCGDITAVLPDLIDIGMDVWETVQLHTLPISAQKLKTEYGRHITFFGGINTQRLPFANEAGVRDEVRRSIEALGEKGGYICGPDHHVKPDVSPQNTLALFKAATSFRRAGYTLMSS